MITVTMMLISIIHFGGQVEGGNISAGNDKKFILQTVFHFGSNSHDNSFAVPIFLNYLPGKKLILVFFQVSNDVKN